MRRRGLGRSRLIRRLCVRWEDSLGRLACFVQIFVGGWKRWWSGGGGFWAWRHLVVFEVVVVVPQVLHRGVLMVEDLRNVSHAGNNWLLRHPNHHWMMSLLCPLVLSRRAAVASSLPLLLHLVAADAVRIEDLLAHQNSSRPLHRKNLLLSTMVH